MRVTVVTLLLMYSLASAQPSATPPLPQPTDGGFAYAFAVNPLARWHDGSGVAASMYFGFGRHHAIRVNAAHFDAVRILPLDAESSLSGGTTDIGVGWQYFPRGWFDGFSLELGILRRTDDIETKDYFASPELERFDRVGYAGRGLIGWSWLVARRAFVAIAAGVSIGRYTGTRTTADWYETTRMTEPYDRIDSTLELYSRFGIALGL